jgi:hypothetical protein
LAREESARVAHRVKDGAAVEMKCEFCGARAPLEDDLPYVKQAASFATGHGCLRRSGYEPSPGDVR